MIKGMDVGKSYLRSFPFLLMNWLMIILTVWENIMRTDTIAAIATALSESGIGIIRISGDEAIQIADQIFRTKNGKQILTTVESHTIHYGFIVDKENKETVLDEVMVSVMRAPRSYTAEDTVEINCHGGVLMMQKILELVLKSGARMAEPGEFTKRAFLNGRIDLAKAEAVIDVIHSQNEFALASSVSQLKGSLSEVVKSIRAAILYEIAFIESALDDPEHISLDGYPDKLKKNVDSFVDKINKLIASADNGKLIKEGIHTVIVGKPNAGKSSLLNLLVGEERAIVTEIAGTTRDVLQESIKLHGIGLNVIDTAGIRSTDDVVEKIGVEKAKKYAAEADLIIYVVDASVPLDENDDKIIPLIQEKNTIILLNKSDLKCIVEEENLLARVKNKNVHIVRTSTKDNTGIDILENTIKELFFKGDIKVNDEVVITNLRHKEALQDAHESLCQVIRSLEDDMPEDFYSIDLMSAYASLGRIIGEEVEEDLVNEIFSKFCMGK